MRGRLGGGHSLRGDAVVGGQHDRLDLLERRSGAGSYGGHPPHTGGHLAVRPVRYGRGGGLALQHREIRQVDGEVGERVVLDLISAHPINVLTSPPPQTGPMLAKGHGGELEGSMNWTWRYESADGTVLEGPEAGLFTSQSDAETWLGLNWKQLSEAGVTQVSLLADDDKGRIHDAADG